MSIGLIGSRYARALLEYVKENNQTLQVYHQAKVINSSYFQFPDLKIAMDNPIMPKSEKRKLLNLAAGGEICDLFNRFFDMLFENNRESHIQSVVLNYIDLYRTKNNIHFGKLVTATEINAEMEKRIVDLVNLSTGGTLEIDKIVDPEILGGFVLEIDFMRWDASISSQLNYIRKDYIDKNRNIL